MTKRRGRLAKPPGEKMVKRTLRTDDATWQRYHESAAAAGMKTNTWLLARIDGTI